MLILPTLTLTTEAQVTEAAAWAARDQDTARAARALEEAEQETSAVRKHHAAAVPPLRKRSCERKNVHLSANFFPARNDMQLSICRASFKLVLGSAICRLAVFATH